MANNAINVANGYNPFQLNHDDHPLLPSVLMHDGCVLSHIEAMHTMVDWMKTNLEKAQTNLIVAQNQAKAHVDHSRCDETYEVGDEVALSICNLYINKNLPTKLCQHQIGTY